MKEYELTDKGLDFLPVLLSLAAWGGRWLSPDGAPLELIDPETNRAVLPTVVDQNTGRCLKAGAVGVRPGPGASPALREAMKARRVVFGASAGARGAL